MTKKQGWSCFRGVSKWEVVGDEGSFSLAIEDWLMIPEETGSGNRGQTWCFIDLICRTIYYYI
jgi:hypothetical protein